MSQCFECDNVITGTPTIGTCQGHAIEFCSPDCLNAFREVFKPAPAVAEWTPKGPKEPHCFHSGLPLIMTAEGEPERTVIDYGAPIKVRRAA